jgi:threonyl-tRNA synthetase
MHGLFRVRGFTQDDAHIFCLPNQVGAAGQGPGRWAMRARARWLRASRRSPAPAPTPPPPPNPPPQIASEIKGVLDLTEELLSTFGFTKYEVNLSTRPEKSVGDDEIWGTAEAALREALGLKGWDYVVDEVRLGGGGALGRLGGGLSRMPCSGRLQPPRRRPCLGRPRPGGPRHPPPPPSPIPRPHPPTHPPPHPPTHPPTPPPHPRPPTPQGGGAFYGPKIDIKIQDALGRKWQCSTIQLDFNLPLRFDMAYVADDASKQRPIMIHRAIFGSLERFFGILVENYAGAFPLWLAPVQVRLLPVNDAFMPYAQEAAAALRAAGLRVEVMERASIAKMIRTAEKAKTPVMAVVGAKEAEGRALSVRLYGGADLGSLPLEEVARRGAAAVAARTGF